MIDIHSHLIWGLDDGPASIAESLAMLDAASQDGTTDIVATPHSNAQYAYDVETIDRRISELAAATGGSPRIHRGCEFHLSFDNVHHLLERPSTYTINGGPYLLVECPEFHVGRHTEGVLRRLIAAGLAPIITHPERSPVLQKKTDRLEEWVDLGCLVQVTALSITGGFGRRARSAALRLLDNGLVHLIASDAHDPVHRHPRLADACRAVRSRFDEETAELLLQANPRRVLEGLHLPGGKQALAPPTVRWWQF